MNRANGLSRPFFAGLRGACAIHGAALTLVALGAHERAGAG